VNGGWGGGVGGQAGVDLQASAICEQRSWGRPMPSRGQEGRGQLGVEAQWRWRLTSLPSGARR
jgi:hypothetical protein